MKIQKKIVLYFFLFNCYLSFAQDKSIIYDNAGNRIKQQSECAKIDCPIRGVNFDTPCNDGNPKTVNDRVRKDCGCRGDSVSSKIIFNCLKDINLKPDNGSMGAIVAWTPPSVFSTFRSNNLSNTNQLAGFRYIGRFGNSEFYISTGIKNWQNAHQDCLSNGGYLAIVSSMDENKFIASHLDRTTAAFIGIKASIKAGFFKRVDGSELLFENWETGYPKDSKTLRQECVGMLGWADGRWATLNHAAEFYYVMEKPINNDITLVQTSGLPSGSLFPIGTTKITYLAIDAIGNRDSCSFNIIVSQRPNACNAPYNVAYLQKATMSSSQFNTKAMDVVDGNTYGDLFGGFSVAHTEWERNSWIEIDLGQNHNIDSIKIWNRSDCCVNIFKNYYIFVSEDAFSSKDLNNTIQQRGVKSMFQNAQAGFPSGIKLTNQKGRYVRLQLKGDGFINLAEVEIIGCPVNGSSPSTNTNNSGLQIFKPVLELKVNKEGKKSFLQWVNNTQVLNDSFLVQRSIDGYNYENIVSLSAKGGKNVPDFYNTYDEDPYEGNNLYRIYLKLADGSSKISNVGTLVFEKSKGLDIFPNPASDFLNVNLKLFKGKTIDMTIVNMFGQEVFSEKIQKVENNERMLDLGPLDLADGFYTLVIYYRGRSFSRAFVVHK
jgi:Lectin C-type domain/F5/8 type C domain/HYR domain/Secretion system C-terminal sorting domain